MVDPGKARDVNEAARRLADTLAESHRVVYEQAANPRQRRPPFRSQATTR